MHNDENDKTVRTESGISRNLALSNLGEPALTQSAPLPREVPRPPPLAGPERDRRTSGFMEHGQAGPPRYWGRGASGVLTRVMRPVQPCLRLSLPGCRSRRSSSEGWRCPRTRARFHLQPRARRVGEDSPLAAPQSLGPAWQS